MRPRNRTRVPSPPKTLAAVDVGTNTVRMLIAARDEGIHQMGIWPSVYGMETGGSGVKRIR